ncbi:nucleoside hydrolase [Acutalibacter sp. 1XD8-33]|uniref:nucleoside hydrolase n=1 Tax=Acutalibacter sp. 1XD8-33 TaxID=2320081 RepID=UPI000EA1C892|nr:nucleoside hydrolase [Acutalibacter sp. 1XD8-33]RKJ42065.1 nucleoside hydrolase [Acutalibacter sp. 1XD8-33]
MTLEQRIRNLAVPQGPVDVVLDTDTYNEIDDQFALAYLLRSSDRLNTRAIYAAPFFNENSTGPEDGMLRSYEEIFKVLELMGEERPVYKGSPRYLPDERTPVKSPAAADLAERAKAYSPERPLYVVAIGAITNIASAILLSPQVAENTVVVWLGGHGLDYHDTAEFNMMQDVAAARVVMGSGVPFVQLPCMGVVSGFATSRPELEYWLKGKNPLADYLQANTIAAAESYAKGSAWTRVIWDVTAVAWLLNQEDRFMLSRVRPAALPAYDNKYTLNQDGLLMRYVYHIHRDALFTDLFTKLAASEEGR